MDDIYIEGKALQISDDLAIVLRADSLVYPALGITEDVEKYSLKGTKRKRGMKLDDEHLVRPHSSNPLYQTFTCF